MMGSLASIVVLSYDGIGHLETCLSSLERQTYHPREIILLDNGSTDGTAAYVQAKFPHVRLVRVEKNRGVPGGLNAGAAAARGEYIAMINNDTEADPGWVAESVKALEAHPDVGITASRIRMFALRTHLDSAGDYYFRTCYPGKRGSMMRDGPEFDSEAWVFAACGGAAVYRQSMIARIGLFDEDYFACFEDLDLSFRAQVAGYRCLYVGSAIIYHKLGATLGRGLSNPQQQFRMHRNRWYTAIKNLPSSLLFRYLAQTLAAEILTLGSSARRGQLGVLLSARAEVFRQMHALLEKRRGVQKLRTVSADQLDALIRKDWLSFHMETRRREAAFARHGAARSPSG